MENKTTNLVPDIEIYRTVVIVFTRRENRFFATFKNPDTNKIEVLKGDIGAKTKDGFYHVVKKSIDISFQLSRLV